MRLLLCPREWPRATASLAALVTIPAIGAGQDASSTLVRGNGGAVSACYAFEVRTPQQVVDQADAIAVVKAPARYAAAADPEEPVFRPTGSLEFEVVQVLRGELRNVIRAAGTLVGRDDYNRGTVPYRSVRSDGEASCFAQTYKPGAYYLFLLKGDVVWHTPYWSVMAPTTEQLEHAFQQDPWFLWVSSRIGATPTASTATSSNCPVINWLSFVGATDGIGWYRNFDNYPWDDPSEHLRRSPLMYIGNVTTPTMLMTGVKDLRTPISQTEEFYAALQVMRVPTAMIRFNDEWHGTSSKPSNYLRTQLYLRHWFERYMTDDAMPMQLKKAQSEMSNTTAERN